MHARIQLSFKHACHHVRVRTILMMLTEITYEHSELHQLCQNLYKVTFHFVSVTGILCARVPVFKNYLHFFPPIFE